MSNNIMKLTLILGLIVSTTPVLLGYITNIPLRIFFIEKPLIGAIKNNKFCYIKTPYQGLFANKKLLGVITDKPQIV